MATALPSAAAAEWNPGEFMARLETLPWWSGALLLAVSLVFLLAGWRMARAVVMMSTGLVCAAVLHQALRGLDLPVWAPPAAAVLAGVVGLLLGGFAYRLRGALLGASALGGLLLLPGLVLELPLLLVLGAALGVILGAVLGWHFIRHVDAVISAILGAYLVVLACAALLPAFPEGWERLAAVVGFVLVVALGIGYQIRDIESSLPRGEPDTDEA